jgi:hypothetical protein
MSRCYPLALNAVTALSDVVSGLEGATRQALVDALKRDQAKLALIAQWAQQAQVLRMFLSLLCLCQACRTMEATERLRHTLVPLLDKAALAFFDEVVQAHLSTLLDQQAWATQAVVAWFYIQKGDVE